MYQCLKLSLTALLLLSFEFAFAKSIDSIVDELIEALKASESEDYIGEEISQLRHALLAASLAKEISSDEELVIACLLHDIGHRPVASNIDSGEFGVENHEKVGADYLRSLGFSERVAQYVEGHTQAKRYLVYNDPTYVDNLSSPSQESLKKQGGPMLEEEAKAFREDPYFASKILLRIIDDKAKDPKKKVADVDSYRDILVKHLQMEASKSSLSD